MKENIENLELRYFDLQHQNSLLKDQNVLLNQENLDFKKRILEGHLKESEKFHFRTCYNAKYKRETTQQQLNNERHLSLNEFSKLLGNLFQDEKVNVSRSSAIRMNISSFEAAKFSSAPNLLNQDCTKKGHNYSIVVPKKESTFDSLGSRPFKPPENAIIQNEYGMNTQDKSMYDICFDVLKSGYQ